MDRESRRTQAREERRVEEEALRPPDAVPAGTAPRRERTSPGEYMREVRQELRKVAWPGREEVFSYTVVVIVATAFLMSLVFGMDFIFGRLVFVIFGS